MKKICPICSADNTKEFWPQVFEGPNLKVRLCNSCESFYLDPPRTVEDQNKFDVKYERYISKREELVKPHLPVTFSKSVDISIQERFEDLKQYFQGETSVLEVGAEKGGFLDLLKPSVCRQVGVDACPEYRDLLSQKGYESYLYITDVPLSQKFDRICFFSLLEHVLDPISFLKEVSKRLQKNGLVVFEIPSSQEPLVSLYNVSAFKSFYFQAMHPYVYSVKAIDSILKAAGLTLKEIKPKQRYGLENHLQWLSVGKPGGSALYRDIFDPMAESAYKKALERAGFTDTIYIIAS